MKKPSLFPLVWSGILLIVPGLLACSASYSGPAEPITLGTVLQEVSLPIFVAEDQNFFPENGLNVTMKYYDSGAQAINGVLNGEIDILAPTSEYVLVNQLLANKPLQTIGCIDRLDFTSVIARKDHLVSTVADLKGKRIGLVRDTATEFILGRFLTLNGLDVKDVTLVDTASNPRTIDAVVSGQVDAIITVSPYAENAERDLGANALSWKAQGGQAIYALLVGQKPWITGHRAVVERLAKAIDQAENFIFQNPDGARALAKNKLNLSDEDVSRAWTRNQFSLVLDQSLVAAMEDEARWIIANNMTTSKEAPNFNDYIYADALGAVKPEAVNIIK